MKNPSCDGSHRFFVAETGFDALGNIIVILVCTSCGEPLKHEFQVPAGVQLQSQTKKEN